MSKHVYISDLDPDEYEQALMSVIVEHREKVRNRALSEVLEWINKSREQYPANWNKHPDLMLKTLEVWLTKQIDAT